MKTDKEAAKVIMNGYADSECVSSEVVYNLINMRHELKSGITFSSIKRIRKYLTEDTVTYMFRKNVFHDDESEYDDYYRSNIVMDCGDLGKYPGLSLKQLVALETIAKRYIYPFCDMVFNKLLDYYDTYMQV